MEGDELMETIKLKHIKKWLEKSEKNSDEALRQKAVSELQRRYSNELSKNPNSAEVAQILNIMTMYKCKKSPEQETKDSSIYSQKSKSSKSQSNSEKLGQPFVNPYSFMPFSDVSGKLAHPTHHSIDEGEKRFSGILKFNVNLNSPLMTLMAEPDNGIDAKHGNYKALTIGSSVIYPSTGVRGSLRHLMTMITGGRLRYLDNEMYVVEDRWDSEKKANKNFQLALISKVGGRDKFGKVVLGKQKPIRAIDVESLFRRHNKDINEYRKNGKLVWVKWDWNNEKVPSSLNFSDKPPSGYNKVLKISGIPINPKKKEWIFEPDYSREIEISPEHWVIYMNRYLNSPFNELKKQNVVWLEPVMEDNDRQKTIINDDTDIQSIQWSKWGKEGDRMADLLPDYVKPGYQVKKHKKVDEVTNLFGQVPSEKKYADKAPTFAGRIRPDNLVFQNGVSKLETVTLAPLARPHAGCKAFYRKSNYGDINGYKVYHTTKEKGTNAPHLYSTQPIYKNGKAEHSKQKMNKTVQLLQENITGTLSISFSALSEKEYSLLRLVCSLPQRFGGGKPFGLGLCSLKLVAVTNEFGQKVNEPVENWKDLTKAFAGRAELYTASQQPVEKLRYPLSAEINGYSVVRAGHEWFKFNASVKKSDGTLRKFPVKRNSEAEKKLGAALAIQKLPELSRSQEENLLYGYDLFFKKMKVNRVEQITDFKLFNEATDFKSSKRPGYNHSPNRESRQKKKSER